MRRSEEFDIITPAGHAENALAMRVIGWTLIVHAGLLSIFIFQGLRDGSLVWLLWTLSQSVFGLMLVGAGEKRTAEASVAEGFLAPGNAPVASVPATVVNEPPRNRAA